jgi:hypothetical protein
LEQSKIKNQLVFMGGAVVIKPAGVFNGQPYNAKVDLNSFAKYGSTSIENFVRLADTLSDPMNYATIESLRLQAGVEKPAHIRELEEMRLLYSEYEKTKIVEPVKTK